VAGPDDAALAALERRVTQRLLRAAARLVSRVSRAVDTAARAHPDRTGGELLTDAALHRSVTEELARLGREAATTVRAAHAAAARLGLLSARAHLRSLGHQVVGPTVADDYRDAVLADVDRAVQGALPDLQQVLQVAHDGVSGPAAAATRRLTTHAAARQAARRVLVRLGSAASSALHRAYTDAQAAAYDTYTAANPAAGLVKTWRVTSSAPCPACRALDGVSVAAFAQFDRIAGAPQRLIGVFRDLSGPPRHPHCRCRLDYGFLAARQDGATFR